jgi:hypothetical protein
MTPHLAVESYRKLKADALKQALLPARKSPTQAVLAWRKHLLDLLALHVANSGEAPRPAELLKLQRAAETALRSKE